MEKLKNQEKGKQGEKQGKRGITEKNKTRKTKKKKQNNKIQNKNKYKKN